MAPTTTHVPGSRAIKIPYHGSTDTSGYQSTGRPQRSTTRLAKVGQAAHSDTGNDFSPTSEAWTDSPSSSTVQHAGRLRNAVASPRGHINNIDNDNSMTSLRSQRKDKQRANSNEGRLPPNTHSPLYQTASQSPLGPSMLSSSSYKSVNLNARFSGSQDEPARLITYTKHSQGFTWNDELFLPSYMIGRRGYSRYTGRRFGGSGWGGNHGEEDDDMPDFDEDGEKCPVTDIFVTDEEAAAMMP